ncbi:YfiT family bacillithiol transferase [Gramella sp. AN32]|uniref:YfiT family bacillithiol transferase n=1 Tax=Christiangramia antarctica TaxID=2058158 RepID=A0ABW5X529_9FLAO|nr:putative metal-dependent hydrolase [Gramella sp. AN32]MCM4157688.1 putative metal-dependent hydrolase [Gramella sp. AN32]
MTAAQLELLKYPIGKFSLPERISAETRLEWIQNLKELPATLRSLTEDLSDGQLDTKYRPEGWTVRQLVHHIADSHTHAVMRFKWALTEDHPTIKTYNEKLYAELPDSNFSPIEPSLKQLDGLHERLIFLLNHLEEADFSRSFLHPDSGANVSVLKMCGLYSWHGRHHCAHIEHLGKRKDW